VKADTSAGCAKFAIAALNVTKRRPKRARICGTSIVTASPIGTGRAFGGGATGVSVGNGCTGVEPGTAVGVDDAVGCWTTVFVAVAVGVLVMVGVEVGVTERVGVDAGGSPLNAAIVDAVARGAKERASREPRRYSSAFYIKGLNAAAGESHEVK
jgi:hypothetical protein